MNGPLFWFRHGLRMGVRRAAILLFVLLDSVR